MTSELEDLLEFQMRALGVKDFCREFRFDENRQWRADFAWPAGRVLVECDGGIHTGGRHVRGAGYESDCEKLNRAAELGYRVLRFTRKHIESGEAVALIAKIRRKGPVEQIEIEPGGFKKL